MLFLVADHDRLEERTGRLGVAATIAAVVGRVLYGIATLRAGGRQRGTGDSLTYDLIGRADRTWTCDPCDAEDPHLRR
jgi:hypothetical protein